MRPRAWAGALLALTVTGCASSKPAPNPTEAPEKPGAPAASSAGAGGKIAPALPPPGPPGPVLLPPSTQPLVSIQLRFRTGSVDDPDGQAGITALAAEVMFEGGTEKLTSQQLREALFPYAADWSVRVDKEQTTFAIRVHRDGLEKVSGLLTDALTHPRWDPAEFARLRDAVINDIEKRLRQGDDENLGKEALSELMFAGHRYGWLTSG
ncbi:MAG: M16 family metallopeptidase, partial [Myxococcaceae bacterium]